MCFNCIMLTEKKPINTNLLRIILTPMYPRDLSTLFFFLACSSAPQQQTAFTCHVKPQAFQSSPSSVNPVTTAADNLLMLHIKSQIPSKSAPLFGYYWPSRAPRWNPQNNWASSGSKSHTEWLPKFLTMQWSQQLIVKLWYKLCSKWVRNIRSLCPDAFYWVQ